MGWNVSKTFVTKSIYGLIAAMVVVLLLKGNPPTALECIVRLLGTTLAVALVETYAETIGAMLDKQHRLTRTEIVKIWWHVAPVISGALPPTFVLILSVFGFFPVEQAIDIAQIVIFLFLGGYGVLVARILHAGLLMQVLSGLMVVAFAALLVIIEILIK